MKFKFIRLTLTCKEDIVEVDLSSQINFFHGPISTGKSTIARLIKFALGGSLEKTTAITSELVSVKLEAHLANNEAVFQRNIGSNQIQATWINELEEVVNLNAPIIEPNEAEPLLEGEEVYTFSDLLFYLLDSKPVKVRKSTHNSDSPLERLSFKNILWYCYLVQDELDSSFFHLNESSKKYASRNTIKYILGYNNEKLVELENKLSEVTGTRNSKLETAHQFKELFEELGFDSEDKIFEEIKENTSQLEKMQFEKVKLRDDYRSDTHFIDEVRARLTLLSRDIQTSRQALFDIEDKVEQQKKLKAEFISSKFKLAKTSTAMSVLSGVSFEFCPCCGLKVHKPDQNEKEACILCHSSAKESGYKTDNQLPQTDFMQKDLDARIDELDYSIKRLQKSKGKQKNAIENLAYEKSILDRQLEDQLHTYDSGYLAKSRSIEQAIARLTESIKNLNHNAKLPKAITKLEKEADELSLTQIQLRRQIEEYKKRLTDSDSLIEVLEVTYLKTLRRVGVPEVKEGDIVRINRTDWIPSVFTGPDNTIKKNFYDGIGSGGVKTLFNVCYALSVHEVASRYGLPLPTFLIIDTPMKNIGKDINPEIFTAFYQYLYELVKGPLSETQFIIIDDKFVPPHSEDIPVSSKLMDRSDEHPALIPYFKG